MTEIVIKGIQDQKYKACEIKKKYLTAKDCRANVLNILNHNTLVANKVLIYECPFCLGWHFTYK